MLKLAYELKMNINIISNSNTNTPPPCARIFYFVYSWYYLGFPAIPSSRNPEPSQALRLCKSCIRFETDRSRTTIQCSHRCLSAIQRSQRKETENLDGFFSTESTALGTEVWTEGGERDASASPEAGRRHRGRRDGDGGRVSGRRRREELWGNALEHVKIRAEQSISRLLKIWCSSLICSAFGNPPKEWSSFIWPPEKVWI